MGPFGPRRETATLSRDSSVAKRAGLELHLAEKRPQVDALMFRHAIVLAVAVVAALGMAQAMKLSGAHVAPPALAQASQEVAAPVEAASDDPATVAAPETTDAQVSKAADGHFWAEVEVNGRWIRCLIDTGASYVALTRADAERLGFDPATLTYDAPVVTANGRTQAARVQLTDVTVSGARVEQVPALVIADGLSTSLLGMSYLGRLSRFEATPTSLILRR